MENAALRPAARQRLADLVLRAGGFISRRDARWLAPKLPAISAEDPELGRVLRGLVVV